MKKITFTLQLLILILASVFAQAPKTFRYQAIARDNTGNIISNQDVSFRVSILGGEPGGIIIYTETHDTTTNEFGLVNIEIGNGDADFGIFETIDWGGDNYFLQIEIDESGGTNYQLMGTSQLLSVPYANYAATTGDTTMWQKESENIFYKKGKVGIGTNLPTETLDIFGRLKLTDGTEGTNRVLTSDESGKASWENINDVNKGFTNPEYPDGTDGVTPIAKKVSQTTEYIVPQGKNFYILNVFNDYANNQLQINHIPFTKGSYNNAESVNSLMLTNPLIAGEGDTINGSSNDYISINGYLVGLSSNSGGQTFVNCGDLFTDDRDGQTYSTVQIGMQCWMAENLAFLPSVSPANVSSFTDPPYYVYGYSGGNVIEASTEENYHNYGTLYNWPAALTACPENWHLPTNDEWTLLTNNLGGSSTAGGSMKSTRTSPDPHPRWNSPNSGASNSSGLGVLPGGARISYSEFTGLGSYCQLWSSTESPSTNVWYRRLGAFQQSVDVYTNTKEFGYSVRCIKD
ncbi:MAG: FISUMP domain-containing protein [Bacteroidales bacterium]